MNQEIPFKLGFCGDQQFLDNCEGVIEVLHCEKLNRMRVFAMFGEKLGLNERPQSLVFFGDDYDDF